MKRLWLILWLTPLLFSLCFIPVRAEEAVTEDILETVLEQAESVNHPDFSLTDTARKLISGNGDFSFSAISEKVGEMLWGELKENISLLVEILVLSVLAGVLCNLQIDRPGDGISQISFLACFSVIAGLSVTVIATLSELAQKTIDNLMLFISSLMPVLSSLVMATKISAFSGFYPALFFAMQSFTAICQQVFLPLIMMITALSVVNAMSNRFHITRLIETARQLIQWGLGLLLTVFVGILGLRGFSVFAAGSVAGRTVKYALCNFVPLVGSVLAESAEAVISSIRLIRGAIGLSGAVGLIVLCAAPLLKILTVSVLYRFAAGVAEPATEKRIVRLLMDLAGNITLIFVIVLMVTVMFIISIALLCGLCR
ncbi:MAG: stage III sporulation protein AE [Clostridia bacterium]|nr:stage III sporulation protein AE [Clostridia bacterium]